MNVKTLIDLDPWLASYKSVITQREKFLRQAETRLLNSQTPDQFALGFHYFGLHQTASGWIFREWAPNATAIFLVGDFSNWQEKAEFSLKPSPNGQWQAEFPPETFKHGQLYKLHVYWDGGDGWRLPSYVKRVIQEKDSIDFVAEIWAPKLLYQWKNQSPQPPPTPLIYEAHIGMSSERPEVASFDHFTQEILPRIKQAGYNTVQLMAIAEHPYYGSFGYHVTNFFAVSSRFGTPDDFKRLVDTAHGLGLRVIIDLVHSHSARNEAEGLSRFDGTLTQYFQGDHPAWDSRLFNYSKPEVVHFLASNCRWWLDEYHVDGFRFDGVTSMIYHHHGLEKSFADYSDYFGEDVNLDALAYLRLANSVIHAVNPNATTIAEDMSGYPGLATSAEHGGIGFDYRLNMGAPDLWIKTLKERQDEAWDLGDLFHTLSSHRQEEKVITYTESHDQALVGDKTLIFRLIDKEMYDHMDKIDTNTQVERGIALHKLIRLFTVATHGGGYLNFMGNEFGHPEWIDFPRQGNNWSFHHARRQWSLVDNGFLKYQWLANFDKALMAVAEKINGEFHHVFINQHDHTVCFQRSKWLFCLNFSPNDSYANFSVQADPGSYEIILDSDLAEFGGHERISKNQRFFTQPESGQHALRLYLPARTGLILQKID